ncbi:MULTISPECIES: helix-turn-helix domain-containing protein [Streptococcus]|uniref:Helix-turn-helix transcriptional regulator n=1 Tax=Streptococcus suis TaxID=1307 RepID=A0A0M9FE96_STRSU|nr:MULTISPECIES: helix-turn-helix transcriptional regulator [Streptococcus]ANM47433.1 hypothetical protein [Streptococcus phage phiJH1301-1]ATZ02927.1 XRE family transcriptional regulator [Streptococcus suis]AUW26658.1 XRE family transcriptional regulator [Streptococcus suis]AZR97727.1 hypothetical protein A7J10_07725 [Streptococcus suis]KPA63465.1 hypothetical protein XK27_11795 [Streptococcus suis]
MTETAFEKLLNDSGMKRNVIAERMGLTRSGFYRKQKKPKERFDGDEMAKLAEVIGVDPQKVLAAILIS